MYIHEKVFHLSLFTDIVIFESCLVTKSVTKRKIEAPLPKMYSNQ